MVTVVLYYYTCGVELNGYCGTVYYTCGAELYGYCGSVLLFV